MMITAIYDGGDWSDASVVHLVLPEGMNIHAEHTAWRRWYTQTYVPSLSGPAMPGEQKTVKFMAFPDWLKHRGARETQADELMIFWSTP